MKKIFLIFLFTFSSFNIFTPLNLFAAGEMESIRNDLFSLKKSVEKSNIELAEAMNTLVVIQQELNKLKGSSESGHFFYEQTKSLRDYDQRIAALEDKIGLAFTLLNDIKENKASEKTLAADETQTREFQKLLDLINAQDYSKSLAGFQGFLQKYPKSNLADQAQYWIAESLYALGDYKKAIAEYQNVIQKFPKSNKVKAALLKQGQSFMSLQMLTEAKAFFEKIVLTYPGSSEASRANAKIKEIERMSDQTTPLSQPSSAPASAIENIQSTNNKNRNTSTPNTSTMSGGIY